MPPRIAAPSCLRAQAVPASNGAAIAPLRTFSSSLRQQQQSALAKRKKHDPYLIAQAKARKAANLSRQQELQKERAAALGDPVRGVTTPFVQSFDTGAPLETELKNIPKLNHFLSPSEVNTSILRSEQLSAPLQYDTNKLNSESILSLASKEERETAHSNAATAIQRIVALDNGSSKDRLRANVQRCIDTFGRHNTDKTLPPKPRAAQDTSPDTPPKRVGADTGSSEVQIAILTAKIRTLANFLETRGKSDKVNKRNLQLLVHRRQKLLQYLRRKERGGPRWQHLIETLGLTEGTWKGEISL